MRAKQCRGDFASHQGFVIARVEATKSNKK